MVKGIEVFKKYFGSYTGQYVFIGGTACDIILGTKNVEFRATKDLDMVLIIEALNEEFVNTFISFIKAGGYQHINKGTGKNQFYRFSKPTNDKYPVMIELLCRKPDYIKSLGTSLGPIHISDDVLSLSAILLDNEYYELLRNGAIDVDGVSVLDIEYLILFKIKAWLDLSERKLNGEKVDSKNIKKHKYDVIRLVINLEPESKIDISGQVKNDAELFFEKIESEPFDLKNLGIRISIEDIISRAKQCFNLE